MPTKRQPGTDFVRSDIRRAMLKVHILWRAANGEANPYSLTKEFGGDKVISSFFADKKELRNDVYNAVRSLEKAGLLVSSRRIENGRLKQYYAITEGGEKVLDSSVKEFLRGSKGVAALFLK